MACEKESLKLAKDNLVDIFLVPIGRNAQQLSVSLLRNLRNANLASDMAYGDKGLKGAMKAADKSGARFAVVLGDEEVANAQVQIKDLSNSSQVQVSIGDMVKHLAQALRQN
jgi:histidyl-tRNA synthetase